jgi:hypothetical protein
LIRLFCLCARSNACITVREYECVKICRKDRQYLPFPGLLIYTHNGIITQEANSQLRNLVTAFWRSDGAEHSALLDQ